MLPGAGTVRSLPQHGPSLQQDMPRNTKKKTSTWARCNAIFTEVNIVPTIDICDKNKIDGYPTVNVYHKGRFVAEFNQDNTIENLNNFVLKYARMNGYNKNIPSINKTLEEPKTKGIVKKLRQKELKNIIQNKRKNWIIKYFSPSCPHCQRFEPIFLSFAKIKKNVLNFGEFDCLNNQKYCLEELKINGLPTVRYYSENTKSNNEMVGFVNAFELSKFTLKFSEPVFKVVNNLSALKKVEIYPKLVFYDKKENLNSIKSRLNGNYMFGELIYTKDERILKKYSTSDNNLVAMLDNQETDANTELALFVINLDSDNNEVVASVASQEVVQNDEMLISFINANMFPKVVVMDQDNINDLIDLSTARSLVLYFYKEYNQQDFAKYNQLATHSNSAVVFCYVDYNAFDKNEQVKSFINVSKDVEPNMILIVDKSKNKFIFDNKNKLLNFDNLNSSIHDQFLNQKSIYQSIVSFDNNNSLYYTVPIVSVLLFFFIYLFIRRRRRRYESYRKID